MAENVGLACDMGRQFIMTGLARKQTRPPAALECGPATARTARTGRAREGRRRVSGRQGVGQGREMFGSDSS
jgi:hypothetical protein